MDGSKEATGSVRVIDLVRHVDDRGDLCELWRQSWDLKEPSRITMRQVYTVFDPQPMTVRAYHRHKHLWDLFTIVSGSAKFHVVEGPDDFPLPPTGNSNMRSRFSGDDTLITLSSRKPQLLVVPPLYWHGWMSLEPGTMLLCLASHEYNRGKPDEERVPFNAFGGHIWEVHHK